MQLRRFVLGLGVIAIKKCILISKTDPIHPKTSSRLVGWPTRTDGIMTDTAKRSHDLRQPLNVISLAAANLRARLGPRLDPADADYLNEKLDRIEQQVARAAELIERKADR